MNNRNNIRSLKAEQQIREEPKLETDLDLEELRRVPHVSRKEVIQPQVPLRLPCYDFTPVTSHYLGTYLPCGLAKPLL
jgi:hypothetical protein